MGGLRNNFNRDHLKAYFLYNYECWICGQNQQDAFHHITGRKYDCSTSILNAAPVHNQQCHLDKSGWLHKSDVELMLLKKTLNYLLRQGYIFNKKDKEFMEKYSKYYRKL
jgi:hypothetical protein